jgi:hypothetical protein
MGGRGTPALFQDGFAVSAKWFHPAGFLARFAEFRGGDPLQARGRLPRWNIGSPNLGQRPPMSAARSWRAGRERNWRLPPEFGEAEMAMLRGHIDPLTEGRPECCPTSASAAARGSLFWLLARTRGRGKASK